MPGLWPKSGLAWGEVKRPHCCGSQFFPGDPGVWMPGPRALRIRHLKPSRLGLRESTPGFAVGDFWSALRSSWTSTRVEGVRSRVQPASGAASTKKASHALAGNWVFVLRTCHFTRSFKCIGQEWFEPKSVLERVSGDTGAGGITCFCGAIWRPVGPKCEPVRRGNQWGSRGGSSGHSTPGGHWQTPCPRWSAVWMRSWGLPAE